MSDVMEDIQERFMILTNPYIKVNDISKVTNLSRSSVERIIRDKGIRSRNYYGLITREVRDAFELEGYYNDLKSIVMGYE